MRWIGRRQSENVEDRRGARGMRIGIGGGVGVLLLVIVVALLGGDPRQLLESLPQGEEVQVTDKGGAAPPLGSPEEEKLRTFVSVVLADTEDNWRAIFSGLGQPYEDPRLVLFSGAIDSACGFAQSAVGPFYCAENQKLYIDLDFYRDLRERFGAPGEFAQAYVIAHEIGHHVQNQLGVLERVHAAQQRADREEANALSVRLELQADCLAGIWAHHARESRQLLDPGDIDEGLRAASAIGDDRIQMQSQGYVAPESFTHGSSAQRARWFRRGVESGDLEACDTFRDPSE